MRSYWIMHTQDLLRGIRDCESRQWWWLCSPMNTATPELCHCQCSEQQILYLVQLIKNVWRQTKGPFLRCEEGHGVCTWPQAPIPVYWFPSFSFVLKLSVLSLSPFWLKMETWEISRYPMSALGVHVHHSPSKILGMSHSESLSYESAETGLYPTLGQLAPIVRLLHTLKFLLPRRFRNKNTPKLYSQRCLVEYTQSNENWEQPNSPEGEYGQSNNGWGLLSVMLCKMYMISHSMWEKWTLTFNLLSSGHPLHHGKQIIHTWLVGL